MIPISVRIYGHRHALSNSLLYPLRLTKSSVRHSAMLFDVFIRIRAIPIRYFSIRLAITAIFIIKAVYTSHLQCLLTPPDTNQPPRINS